MSSVHLIPGTSLPFIPPGAADQVEGRGDVIINPDRQGPQTSERVANEDLISAQAYAVVEAALRAFDRKERRETHYYVESADQTDATTGSAVMQLFEVPQGMEGHVSNVIVDVPQSATLTPSAPYANAASFMFLAISGPTNTDNDNAALVTGLRAGMVAFAPISAGGPMLPGQWTFNDSNAPIIFGGQTLYFVLNGGSQAAILNLYLRARTRINLLSLR